MTRIFTTLLWVLILGSASAQTPNCDLVANFTTIPANTPNLFYFQNTSTALATNDSIRWSFGDGSYSNTVNTYHIYAVAGTYNVCLRIIHRDATGLLTNCISEICHSATLTGPTSCNLVANFTSTPITTTTNTYHFTNASTGMASTDSIRWTFGDGSESHEFSPDHTYAQAGTYNVCLRIQHRDANGVSTSCLSEICHTLVIQSPCNLLVNFTATQTSVFNTWHFENTSVPINSTDSIYWTFGDGTNTNALNPTHTFQQSGTYNVCLIIRQRDANGVLTGCVRYVCHSIVVPSTCNLSASFTSTQITSIPNTFHFLNTTTGLATTDSVHWTFGDGNASNDISADHTYSVAGTYNVCLRVQHRDANGVLTNCISDICHTITIVATCNLVVNFTSTQTSAVNTWHFENTSVPINSTDSIYWTFGDGTNSNVLNPTHTYLQSGTFNVCLIVRQREASGTLTGCVRYICHTIVVPPNCNLVTGFTAITSTNVVNTYYFQNTTTGLATSDSVHWSFGDGETSTLTSPTHTYTHGGTYTVCLRVQHRDANGVLTNCLSDICHTIVVQTPCTLVVDFTATQLTVLNVWHFVNTSVPINTTDSIKWTFGDGTSSSDVNPTHTYLQSGTFTVCLVVRQRDVSGTLTGCVRYICHSIVVPSDCNITAAFVSTLVTTIPNTFHFQNTSTGIAATDSIRWTFGDGAISNDLNPDHTYAQAGTYNVCLRIQRRDANGVLTNCVREICHTVTITSPCTIHAAYTFASDPANPLIIHFNNQTISPTTGATAIWLFGDGQTSTAWSPIHQYLQPGRYRVCLRVALSNTCVSYFCDSITVHSLPAPCGQQSEFTFSTTTNPLSFTFTPNTISSDILYTWTFGDGTGSHDLVSTHSYLASGIYNTCLTTFHDPGCASTTCHPVRAGQINCNNVTVSYNYQSDPLVLNKLYFMAVANYPIVDQVWTITKLPTSATTAPISLHQNDPSFTFNDTGYYRVCLRAVTLGGCVTENCQVIHINHTVLPGNCALQVYPNPATDIVNLNLLLSVGQMIDIYVYNTMSTLVKEKHQQGFPGTNTVALNIGDLPTGSYTMRIVHGNDVCYAQFIKL